MSSENERSGKLLVDGTFVHGRVRFDGGRITAVEPLAEPAPPDAPLVVPGLVDLHVHGFGGREPLADLAGMAAALAAAGTTAFQPTLFPRAPARLGADAERVWQAAQALAGAPAARVLGLHLEGPFVNPRALGALPADGVAEPSPAILGEILGPATGDLRGVRTMTVAPELPGGTALVRALVKAGVRVSLGHSLATAAEAAAAAHAGATGATHLFNAMAPLHHRRAGLALFALSADALRAELIGDLAHVGPEAFGLALKARGTDGLVLVSDALAAGGTACERFESAGTTAVARAGAFWIEDPRAEGGWRLAGAAASQLEAVRRLVYAGVLSAAEALTMATAAPAAAAGHAGELGALVPGARADLLVLSEPALELREVLVGGRPPDPIPAAAPARR